MFLKWFQEELCGLGSLTIEVWLSFSNIFNLYSLFSLLFSLGQSQ